MQETQPAAVGVSNPGQRTTGRGQRAEGNGQRAETVSLLVWALGFRMVSALLAFLVNIVFPLYQREQFTVFQQTHEFWDTFARYDSGWYNGIARDGYRFAEGGRSNLAFFPLYPLLMRTVGRLFGTQPVDFYWGGIIVSWAAFAVAMVVLYRLARVDLPKRAAERAVLYAAVFPFAFFYGVVYSESLFLMLLVTAIYGLRTKQWFLGAVSGALATATRVNGIMALPALMWIAWRSAGSDRRQRIFGIAAAACSAAGVLAYSAYVYSLTGSPFEWYFTITRWSYQPGTQLGGMFVVLLRRMVFQPYEYLTQDRTAPYDFLNGATALCFLISIPFVWRRLGGGYGLLMLANLLLPISTGSYEGLGRYCAVLFPMYIWLATFESPRLQGSVLIAFSMLYLLCLTLFVTIHPLF